MPSHLCGSGSLGGAGTNKSSTLEVTVETTVHDRHTKSGGPLSSSWCDIRYRLCNVDVKDAVPHIRRESLDQFDMFNLCSTMATISPIPAIEQALDFSPATFDILHTHILMQV